VGEKKEKGMNTNQSYLMVVDNNNNNDNKGMRMKIMKNEM